MLCGRRDTARVSTLFLQHAIAAVGDLRRTGPVPSITNGSANRPACIAPGPGRGRVPLEENTSCLRRNADLPPRLTPCRIASTDGKQQSRRRPGSHRPGWRTVQPVATQGGRSFEIFPACFSGHARPPGCRLRRRWGCPLQTTAPAAQPRAVHQNDRPTTSTGPHQHGKNRHAPVFSAEHFSGCLSRRRRFAQDLEGSEGAIR